MSLDERIKNELENEAEKIDEILNDKQGLFELTTATLKNGLGPWMILVSIVILIVTGFMIWTGYRFFVADGVDARIFWGVWFVVTLIMQVALKQWTWMEANRVSLLREVKRAEIAVARLASKIEST